MKSVKIAELKDNLSRYLRAAENGSSVVVTDRGPVAQIVSVLAAEGVDVIPASRPVSSIRGRRFARTRSAFDSLALLLVERGERS